MKIIVFSDSHGNFNALYRVMEMHRDARAFFHLGDGQRELDDIEALYPEKEFYSVCGNCDLASLKQATGLTEIAGKRIMFTHGHMYGVKSGIGALVTSARKNGADIVLYGHTHIPYEEYDDGLYIMNPGSIGKGVFGSRSTYGIIHIVNGQISTNIATL